AARGEVAALQALERQETAEEDGETEAPVTVPVEETPVDAVPVATEDNGVPAKTLIPTDPSGYTVCGRVYISNSTEHTLSIPDVQAPFAAALGKEGPQVLILHTHGSEAYTPVPGTEGIVWSGDYRTTDYRYNVVRVGDEMAEVLGEAGLSVLHDRTLYDYPSYTGAYDRALAAIQKYLERYPSIRFVLDVHRDAIEDGQGNQYKAVSEIEGVGVPAQMSLVMGSDGSGLEHPNWMENLRLAAAVQQDILEHYPTLMRPVLLRNSRYNQHATTGSLLLEVGAAGNSPEEAVLAGRLFAERLAAVLLEKGETGEPAEGMENGESPEEEKDQEAAS
ncbi:MAG: stage II sporulation protein P, partial [Oscillibacter sp.]|nr:stage II sporulation protein P [Oscillibacter sp.]